MLDQREELFRDHGIDSVDQLRALHAAGRLPELAAADIVLLIDGFGALRDEFDELDDAGRRPAQARQRLRHPRRRRHAALERRPHRHPVDVRHPRRTAAERPADSTIDRKLAETLCADTRRAGC